MSQETLSQLEAQLASAVAVYIPTLGLSHHAVRRGATDIGLNEGEVSLLCPNGPQDIAAILWRQFNQVLNDNCSPETLEGLKIRDKIRTLLITWLDAAAADEAVARRLTGNLALPLHLGLYQRLLWESADLIWLKAGDKALDGNHYSKRAIVSGILATALLTRLSQGREAQNEQVERNIEQVMAFEKFKAKLPFKPEDTLLGLFETLGKFRFGTAA
ncbi:MAG: COQ9 family protein [Asticcacaulis sp.]